MKTLYCLIALLAAASPAHALEKVEFTAALDLVICPLKEDGTCIEYNRVTPVAFDELTAQSSPENADLARIEKLYSLKREFGIHTDALLKVSFRRFPRFIKDTMINVQFVAPNQTGETLHAENNMCTISVEEVPADLALSCEGSTTIITAADGSKTALIPSVRISGIKIYP